jgi:putative ABC transport system substrate-binding protein
MRTVGFLHTSVPIEEVRSGFFRGLSEAGYVEGRNVAIVFRFAEGQPDRLPALANDLVQRKVDVIVASGGSLAAQAAKRATGTIPIVFIMGDADPVDIGMVGSLNRPGGNATGMNLLGGALGPKRLAILHEIVPQAKTVAVLVNPTNRNSEPHAREITDAIEAARQRAVVLHAVSADEFSDAFVMLMQQKAEALIVTADIVFTRAARQLTALAARHRIPAIYQWREFVRDGGLLSYGASLFDAVRHVGIYTGPILKGDRPSDLPVLQPTKFDHVINMKTARAVGVTIPASMLATADEVIE